MKNHLAFLLILICAGFSYSVPLQDLKVDVSRNQQIDKKCTLGPTYWCQNITTAAGCKAVRHCIQTVWEHMTLPEDESEVCKICKDMVAQARAQLESNETQEELKEVLEGSCKLIPLKIIAEGCIKVADEFIPELVETLSSQMNPSVVCSVAGLCNNAHINELLEEIQKNKTREAELKCKKCFFMSSMMKKKLGSENRDEILNRLLKICRKTGSYSDSCAAIVITYFNNIYNFYNKQIQDGEFCNLLGVCTRRLFSEFQNEPEITLESSVGMYVHPSSEDEFASKQDDLPCDFCKEVVQHFKDILVSNTTEEEFEQMLQGICKQTGSFADECRSLVDQYYKELYDFLVNDIDPDTLCKEVGLCPSTEEETVPINPMVSANVRDKYLNLIANSKSSEISPGLTTEVKMDKSPQASTESSRIHVPVIHVRERIAGDDEKPKLHRVSLTKHDSAVRVVNVLNPVEYQLPAERFMPQTLMACDSEKCAMCEYFLHYMQTSLSTPSTEEDIKNIVKSACSHFPTAISDQCSGFVDEYGDAVIALLVQEIDPSKVCPSIGLCPSAAVIAAVAAAPQVSTSKPPSPPKPNCPLCLMAIEELQSYLKNNKTVEYIKTALENACTVMKGSLADDCKSFVEYHADYIIDSIAAGFSPEEVCVYIKMCNGTSKHISTGSEQISSNEIPPFPVPAMQVEYLNESSYCVLCEYVMDKIDSQLKSKKTQEEIEQIVRDVCNYMPKTISEECNAFVKQYGDLILTLLASSLEPKQVCTEIHLCGNAHKSGLKDLLKECSNCQITMAVVDKFNKIDENQSVSLLMKACYKLPEDKQKTCVTLINEHGYAIADMIYRREGVNICAKIGLCPPNAQQVHVRRQGIGDSKCTWGPSYWCQSKVHAKECGATQHCVEKVWLGNEPPIVKELTG